MVHPSSFGNPVAAPAVVLARVKLTRTTMENHVTRITRIVTQKQREDTDRKIQQRVWVDRAHAYTSSESWTPHCCERPCWIHYQHSLHSLLLLFSLFCTALDDDERMSRVCRVSLAASYRVSEFLEAYLKEMEYKISNREFMKNRVYFSEENSGWRWILFRRKNFEIQKSIN